MPTYVGNMDQLKAAKDQIETELERFVSTVMNHRIT
jgi:hypothetical protein